MLNTVVLILKGFVLGVSMLLPGVSGGTIAFGLGIYEKLIREISKFQIQHLKALLVCFSFKKSKTKQSFLFFKKTWDWVFLIPLIFGLVLASVVFVVFALAIIKTYSLQFYSLVFGLILASVFKPFKKMKKTGKTFFLLIFSFIINGLIFSYGKALFLLPIELSDFMFLPIGFLISIALIIPGISGSYLLLIFGLYEKTLLALKQGDLFIIFYFFIGFLLGLVLVAKFIQHLIKRHFNETMAVIIGFVLSSLYIIYPLPKESLENILVFDTQKQIFCLYFLTSFLIFMSFDLFKKINKSF